MTAQPFRDLVDQAGLDDVWAAPTAVIFKFSPACWSSRRARREMEAFAAAHPGVPVYIVDVLAHRAVSERIAEVTGVRHESPQVLMLGGGAVRWANSHQGITGTAVAEALATA